MKKIKNLSFNTIYCLSCLDNTEEEEKEIEKFQETEPDWYNKLYDDKIYIPIDTFCKQDFPIIFTEKLIGTMQNERPGYVVSYFNDKKTV